MAVVHLYFGVDVHVADPCDVAMEEPDAGWGYGRPGHSHGYTLIAGLEGLSPLKGDIFIIVGGRGLALHCQCYRGINDISHANTLIP